MGKYRSLTSFYALFFFVVSLVSPAALLAQTNPFDYYQDDQLADDLTQGAISPSSESADLEGQIAPPPVVITTSNGDLFLLQGEGIKAKLSEDQSGTNSTTFYIDGAATVQTDEFGRELNITYSEDGSVVSQVNQSGVVESSSTYALGQMISSTGQGTIMYEYDEKGVLTSSTDQWNNTTHYDQGKPINVTDSNGEIIGVYAYGDDGLLDSYTDNLGNVTVFDSTGVRPVRTENAQGTTTKVYTYDTSGNLIEVANIIDGTSTNVEDGFYTTIQQNNTDSGVPVVTGVFNYNSDNSLSQLVELAENGVVTGFTEYDDYGRVVASYNAQGSQVQAYNYNEHGFLETTVSMGAVDPVTGKQALISVTMFDGNGRPDSVWQLGDSGSKLKIQEYQYKENGTLDMTYSLGIVKDDLGNEVLDSSGNHQYFRTSVTTYDKISRPDAVYNLVRDSDGNVVVDEKSGEQLKEVSQKYGYNGNGFLQLTYSYGANGKMTGRTEFDVYSRPNVSTNTQGSLTQSYQYGTDGFLNKTQNYGEPEVSYDAQGNKVLTPTETGYTIYNAKGRPTEVFNHAGSLVQKYVYDSNGTLSKSLSIGKADGLEIATAATQNDYDAIGALWDPSWDTTYAADFAALVDPATGEVSSAALISAAWDALNEGDTEKAQFFAFKTIQIFTDTADAQQANPWPYDPAFNWAVNDVGTAYFIIAESAGGDSETSQSAYKIIVTDYSASQTIGSSGGWESVGVWATTELEAAGVTTGTITGYTIFGGDSRPTATYSVYNGVASKAQEYDYSYDKTVKLADGTQQTVTGWSSFVRSTVNFGDVENGSQVITGRTLFDDYGRQSYAVNEDGQMVQKYTYSQAGFLFSTASYGKDKTLTSTTLFNANSQPVLTFNYSNRSRLTTEQLAKAKDGLTEADLQSADWQPFLAGLTQTYEYGDDGFLSQTKSWGEATVVSLSSLPQMIKAMGTEKGDSGYKAEFDFTGAVDNQGNQIADGVIDEQDMAFVEQQFSGATAMASALDSVSGDANYSAALDFDNDGDVDKSDLKTFSQQFETGSTRYTPTYTGYTTYDSYGKTEAAYNSDGVVVQKYVYNDAGYLQQSQSFGILTNDQGEAVGADGYTPLQDGEDPISIQTGYTVFSAYSRPVETYSVYDSGSGAGPQAAKVQDYVYVNGFLEQTNNYGDNGVSTGYTTFDKYGRQAGSFNETGAKVSGYTYSSQGFLSQTSNYGINGTFLGKTVFNKQGRPDEAYNFANSLTGTFEYNDYGFLSSSSNYGQPDPETGKPTYTGQTKFDGYGKTLFAENDKGIVVSSYDYNDRGFLTQTNSLAWQSDPAGDLTITNNQGVQDTGYYVVTGHTLFNEYSRPTETYQTYWDTQGETGAKVQSYEYTDGFVTGTVNYGAGGVVTGSTTFDKYGRQQISLNDFGEKVSGFKYSREGFLQSTISYGQGGTVTGTTQFNTLGRPAEALNYAGSLAQTFEYDDFSGQLVSSTSYGDAEVSVDTAGNTVTTQVENGKTTYDAFGKAVTQTNREGYVVSDYSYDRDGFLTRTNSYGDPGDEAAVGAKGPLTGYTTYNASSRPEAAYQVSEQGVETKVQEFVYNTDFSLADAEVGVEVSSPIALGQNTGFLTATVSYGDQGVITGFTMFNKYGQQDTSYNELAEKTGSYKYTRTGFLSESINYGLDGTFLGKTVFSNIGRPEAAYNERGVITQTFNYGATGFLRSSVSHGDPGDAQVLNQADVEATGVSWAALSQELIDSGYAVAVSDTEIITTVFMDATKSSEVAGAIGISSNELRTAMRTGTKDATAMGPVTGTTFYNAFGRQTRTENAEGMTVSSYVYNDAGFLTRTNNLSFNAYAGGADSVTLSDGSTVEGNYLVTGYTEYNERSRPSASYSAYDQNWWSGDSAADHTQYYVLTQTFDYTATSVDRTTGVESTRNTGFVTGTTNYTLNQGTAGHDENGAIVANQIGTEVLVSGHSDYSKLGRPDKSYNETGALISQNNYSRNGFVASTSNYGEGGKLTGQLIFDTNGRPDYAVNYAGAKTTEYRYNNMGLLDHTLGFQNNIATSRTNFDVYSKATDTYSLYTSTAYTKEDLQTAWNVSDGVLDHLPDVSYRYNDAGGNDSTNYTTVTAADGSIDYIPNADATKSQTNVYNAFGAIEQTNNYGRNGTLQGYTKYDTYSRPTEVYNDTGAVAQRYSYSDSGFLAFTTSYFKGQSFDPVTGELTGSYVEQETSRTYFNAFGQQTTSYLVQEDGADGAKQAAYSYNRDGFLSEVRNYSENTVTGRTVFDATGRQSLQYNQAGIVTGVFLYDPNGFLRGTMSTAVQ